MRTVQPVLDRYCISCHGLKEKAGDVNLVHDGKTFPAGALALLDLGNHKLGHKSYMVTNDRNISRPYQFLSPISKLPEMIKNNHGKVKMDRQSFLRIIQWLDMNAPVYGDLYKNKLEDRKIDPKAEKRLRKSIYSTFGKKLANDPIRALINVAQPDESRILMMPLSKKGGGWGQLRAWSSKRSKGYVNMRKLVNACIIKSKTDNTKGWEPTKEMGSSDKWVVESRKRYLEKVKNTK